MNQTNQNLLLSVILFIIVILLLFIANPNYEKENEIINDIAHAKSEILDEVKKLQEQQSKNNEAILSYLSTWSGAEINNNTTTQISPVHYFATVTICPQDASGPYTMKIDFYGLNPRIEGGSLLTGLPPRGDEYSSYEIFPIKMRSYEDKVCGISLLN